MNPMRATAIRTVEPITCIFGALLSSTTFKLTIAIKNSRYQSAVVMFTACTPKVTNPDQTQQSSGALPWLVLSW